MSSHSSLGYTFYVCLHKKQPSGSQHHSHWVRQESLNGLRPETDIGSTGHPVVAESKETWGLGDSSVDIKTASKKSEEIGSLEPMSKSGNCGSQL